MCDKLTVMCSQINLMLTLKLTLTLTLNGKVYFAEYRMQNTELNMYFVDLLLLLLQKKHAELGVFCRIKIAEWTQHMLATRCT